MHQAMVSKLGEGNMFWGGAWFTCDIRHFDCLQHTQLSCCLVMRQNMNHLDLSVKRRCIFPVIYPITG